MIKRNNELVVEEKVHMRDGDGKVIIENFNNQEELLNKARLFAKLTLEPNCGIGKHEHHNEQEYFYILEGNPTYFDDDKEVELHPGDVTVCLDGHSHGITNRTNSTVKLIANIILK